MHSYVHSSIIHRNQDMEATYVSVNRWMDKENIICVTFYIYHVIHIYTQQIYVNTHNRILFSLKEEILALMDEPGGNFAK